jgi:hypothetical protein
MLTNAHALNLSFCRGIQDVSSLTNVHTLDLSWCTGIQDVSMLGNIKNLTLPDHLKTEEITH